MTNHLQETHHHHYNYHQCIFDAQIERKLISLVNHKRSCLLSDFVSSKKVENEEKDVSATRNSCSK